MNSNSTKTRRVPPGCCPECLRFYEGDDCSLHRAAADLLTPYTADELAALVSKGFWRR